jgi:hypothetical protein
MAELHVTNGDVAAEAIRARLNVAPSAMLVWRDVLHEGPVPAGLDAHGLRDLRARFLGERGWADADGARIDMAARDAALAEAVDLATRVTLWFEDDLYDQLQLLQVLDRLRDHNGPITLVALPRKRIDLAFTYGNGRTIGEREVALAHRAWEAFRAPDPAGLNELVRVGTPALPDLAPALRRLLEEYPAAGDGLARTERQALTAVAEGAVTRVEVFLAATEADERPFMGDVPFSWWLDGLCAGPEPLLSCHVGSYALTDAGRACLAGTADRVALSGGIDRWLGGVHLEGRAPAFRWDAAAGAARGTAA